MAGITTRETAQAALRGAPVAGGSMLEGSTGGPLGVDAGAMGVGLPMPAAPATDVGRGAIVPVEKGNVRPQDPDAGAAGLLYGENCEHLPQRLQDALRRLVMQFAGESDHARRQEIRRIKKAHQFWRGLQYIWWSEKDQNWHLPFEQKATDASSLEDMPRYEYVTNIYQAFGLSIIAVLSQDVPRVRFFPQSAQQEEDVAASKAATEVASLVERNNRIGNLIVEEAFHLWTGGKTGAYVRYVVDGQRFGFHPEVEIAAQQVKVGKDLYRCGECGGEQEINGAKEARDAVDAAAAGASEEGAAGASTGGLSAGEMQNGNRQMGGDPYEDTDAPGLAGEVSGAPGAGAAGFGPVGGICEKCGAALDEGNFVPADVVTVPTVRAQMRVPNGQEVITIVGALELKTPPWANEMHEYPYLQWNMEVHQSRLRAAFPHAAEKIGTPVVPGASEQYERMARLSQSQGGPLTEGGDYNLNLITFQRSWLRPWAFFALDDKALRDELLNLFPDGCYCGFAGEAYCEARNESMDDHWRVMHAMPGDGTSNRPALGEALLSVQERFNTLSNLQIETYEYGIPPIYADSEVLDFDALQNQTAEPGAHYPARAKPGQSLASGFYQPAPAQVPPGLANHADTLMGPVAQFLTGAFPALFGGAMANTDTAAGYAMARDQAMGRIGLVWRKMKFFHADVMLLAADTFRKNRPNDVEVTLLGAGAAFESKWIRLADLKGSLFSYPETDEQYPTMWSQQRSVLMQLIANPDPDLHEILGHPENLALIKRLIGLEELVIPDEESHTKQYREMAQLLAEQPVVHTDRQTGVETALPSVMPDAFADNHEAELATCKRWFSSDAGQVAKIENPAGYANVRAHALLHQQFLQQQSAVVQGPSSPGPAQMPHGRRA